ncbi:MAG: hypothetical protein PHD36_08790 [Desulfotomaculaceae bacterium]|nr:hypothetical protein [Desulfotomaculaceae bacterium]
MIKCTKTGYSYKTPWVSFVCSLFIPGLGQLYNQNHLVGITFIFLELLFNNLGNINLSIYYTFNANFSEARDIVNFQWAMFYPCLYAFAPWHAYNEAKNINFQLYNEKISLPARATNLNGLFIGMTVGLNLGFIWGFGGSPIVGTLLGGMIGAIVGVIIENVILKYISNNVKSSKIDIK